MRRLLVTLGLLCATAASAFAADKAILWNGTSGREKGVSTDPVVVSFAGGSSRSIE